MSWSPNNYDKILVSDSTGKDSNACIFALLQAGVDPRKIELWHQCVDGMNPATNFMDWPCTEDFARKQAAALGLPIYFQWRDGGFSREMWRTNERTAPVHFETVDGEVLTVGGTSGPLGTRRMFPQVSANLSVRWCSSALKIDVMASALRNQPRFDNAKTLVVTGERAEESAARAKYKDFEPDRADARKGRKARHVDHWRVVHSWTESQVWEAMEQLDLMPHPAYRMGWGRLSCMTCIFGNDDQWASAEAVSTTAFQGIEQSEAITGKTIHRTKTVSERATSAEPYPAINGDLKLMAMSKVYTGPVRGFELPAGAFGDNTGPT